MSLEDLLGGLQGQASTYSMSADPIYGPLFQGMATGGPGAGPPRPSGGGQIDPNAGVHQMARQMASKYGWDTGPDWRAINKIFTAEAGWNPRAVNPSSGAAGLPQMLPSAHPDVNVQKFLHDPQMQIRWFLNYVKDRYGSPSQAWQARERIGYY